MHKYNPDDFPEDVARDMRKVYNLHEHKDVGDNELLLAFAIDDLHYSLKDLRTYKLRPPEQVLEMQSYFRSLLYD